MVNFFILVKPLEWEPENFIQSAVDGGFYCWFELPENQTEYQFQD